MRVIVFWLYLIGFIVALIGTLSIPEATWKSMELWQIVTYGHSLLLAFSGVLIAYWLKCDGEDIEYSKREIRRLERELIDLKHNPVK